MIGECPLCKIKKIQITEHHVVEAADESGKGPSIGLCNACHVQQERYRNYLKDVCGINIDKTATQDGKTVQEP